MDVNNAEIKDGDLMRPITDAPSIVEVSKQKVDGTVKKKRRRGKSKRKIMKPLSKITWQDRRKYDKIKRNNRFRKIVLAKTHAPFNNNQFLMEIHKPEPESNFHLAQTPSLRTRDSSFSVDSEENCFYSLPEDEEEYLTKEFSSVYEDAQTERLSNMSKDDLIQEYLLLEAKYDNLVKRTERKPRLMEDEKDMTVADKLTTDRDSMLITDTSGTSLESSVSEDPSICEIMQRMKEQEDQIRELQLTNEKLKLENEHLLQRSRNSSSEDSESDSSSSSGSSSSSKRSISPMVEPPEENSHSPNETATNGQNGDADNFATYPLANGFHSPSEQA